MARPLFPFFSYFGSKYRLSRYYPAPLYDTVIEPFAGSACYSLHYWQRNVILCDLNEKVYGTWDYLLHTSPSEIMALPSVVNHVDELSCCQEAKWLIGWHLCRGSAEPANHVSGWMKRGVRDRDLDCSWGFYLKQKIAGQVGCIKHWKAFQSSYTEVGNQQVTWFIDPPYAGPGCAYPHGPEGIDYRHLGAWCKSRQGQTIVCEQLGADWLPFQPFREHNGTTRDRGKPVVKKVEVVWLSS